MLQRIMTIFSKPSHAREEEEPKPSRLEACLRARSDMGEDFFGGWLEEDIEFFSRFKVSNLQAKEDAIVDFLGMETAADLHPWATHLVGTVTSSLPIPDDSLKAEAIEYYALFTAIEACSRSSFTVCELGASYAPWACTASVLATRRGLRPRAVAVEASSFMHSLIEPHFTRNGITQKNADLSFIQGAIGTEQGVMYFPKVTNAGENGGQATSDQSGLDYVGREVEYEEVRAYTLDDILPLEVDLLHVDIQGAELPVLTAAADILNDRVRSIFIGTHSRRIEGELLEFFHNEGWTLHRERPCRIQYHRDRPDVIGWTTRDGGQFWTNPRLSS